MGIRLILRTPGHYLVAGVVGLPFSIRWFNLEPKDIKNYCQDYHGKSEVESGSWKECKGVSGQIKEGEKKKIEYNGATRPGSCKYLLIKYLHWMLAEQKDKDAVNAINGTAH